jgi:hypothetical protein
VPFVLKTLQTDILPDNFPGGLVRTLQLCYTFVNSDFASHVAKVVSGLS